MFMQYHAIFYIQMRSSGGIVALTFRKNKGQQVREVILGKWGKFVQVTVKHWNITASQPQKSHFINICQIRRSLIFDKANHHQTNRKPTKA